MAEGGRESRLGADTVLRCKVPGARRSLAILLLGLLMSIVASGTAAAATGFQNPVVPQSADGADSPDPWIFVEGNRYFLTYTSPGRIEIRSARSLAGLASAKPRVLWRPASGPADACCNLWAPELHRLRDDSGKLRWFIYYTAGKGTVSQQRVHVLRGPREDPRGTYSYAGPLDLGERYAIDANIFATGGRRYVLFSANPAEFVTPTSLYIAELSSPTEIGSPMVEISSPEFPWEAQSMLINEGPQALLHKGLLHVIYSASWCGTGSYRMGRLTVPADGDLLDPATWESAKQPNPVFEAAPGNGIFGPGHGSFFTSPDGRQSWMVYHATNDNKGCFTGGVRLTQAKPFTWRKGGTPNFGSPPALDTGLPKPGGDPSWTAQAEKKLDPASSGSRVVSARTLVGGNGLELTPDSSGDLAQFSLRRARARTMGIAVRLALPSGSLKLKLKIRRAGTKSRPLATATGSGTPGEFKEINFGHVKLPKGKSKLSLSAAGLEAPVLLDQIRFTR